MNNIEIIGSQLYQWEVGRKLTIRPLPNMRVDAVHFSNYGDTEALVVIPKEENGAYTADIPNILLQSGENLVVYTVNVAQDAVETLLDRTFSVRKRAMPSDYVYSETEVLNYATLDKRITKLEQNGTGGSGSVDPETVEQIVVDYLAENPPAPGEPGKDGKDGQDGYTPQKGIDYYTEADKAELVDEISETVTGDIDTALDSIIAIQNELIGGDAE